MKRALVASLVLNASRKVYAQSYVDCKALSWASIGSSDSFSATVAICPRAAHFIINAPFHSDTHNQQGRLLNDTASSNRDTIADKDSQNSQDATAPDLAENIEDEAKVGRGNVFTEAVRQHRELLRGALHSPQIVGNHHTEESTQGPDEGSSLTSTSTPREGLTVFDPSPLPPALRGMTPQVPGQVLYPATEEDIRILSDSTQKYPLPLNVEGGVIIRLVRLSDAVTSPIGRTLRNRQYGIRSNMERWKLLLWGVGCSALIASLGFWQLRRRKWKAALVEYRQRQLAMPRTTLYLEKDSDDLPWVEASMEDWYFRTVECRGVLDAPFTVYVGPRAAMTSGKTGYYLVSPLRFENGKTVLVNRGHCPIEDIEAISKVDIPEWVVIRAVVTPGESLNTLVKWKKLRNRPQDKLFVSMDPQDIGCIMGATNVEACKLSILNVYDILYEEDRVDAASLQSHSGRTRHQHLEKKKKEDYLLFWADEHTHLNYAIQWFLMAALTLGMTLYKFIEVIRWKF